MNNIERYSKVHDIGFEAQAIGAASKDSFIMGAEYVLDNLLPRFKSVEHEWPEAGTPFIYITSNKKVGVVSNSRLDEWFIEKYAVTHWMPTEDLLSLLPL